MPRYRYEIEFEAEDDAEAKDIIAIANVNYGITHQFGDIYEDELVNVETGEVLF